MIKRFVTKAVSIIISKNLDTNQDGAPYFIAVGDIELHPRRPKVEQPAPESKPKPKPKPKPRRRKQVKPKAKRIAKRDMSPMGKTFHSRTPPPPPIPTTPVNGFRYLFNPISQECTRLPATQPFDERLREMLENGFVLVTKAEYQTLKGNKS